MPRLDNEGVAASKRNPLVYGLIYLAASLGVEVVLLVVFRLRVPEDNRILGPLVLTLPPVLAACISGHRWPREFVWVAVLSLVLALAFTMLVTRITGKSVGLLEPIISRTLAGFFAAAITNRMARGTGR